MLVIIIIVHCIACDYDLSNLAGDRCPECGRAFDRDDASTFFAAENLLVSDMLQGARVAAYIALVAPCVAIILTGMALVGMNIVNDVSMILFPLAVVILIADVIIVLCVAIEGWPARRYVYRRILPAILFVGAAWLFACILLYIVWWSEAW